MKKITIMILFLFTMSIMTACGNSGDEPTAASKQSAVRVRYLKETSSETAAVVRCEFPDYMHMSYLSSEYSIVKGKVVAKQEIAVDYKLYPDAKTQTNYYELLTVKLEEVYKKGKQNTGDQLTVVILTSDRQEWRPAKYRYETGKAYVFFLNDDYKLSRVIDFHEFSDAVSAIAPIQDLLMTENCQLTELMAMLLNYNAELLGSQKRFTTDDKLEDALRSMFGEMK